MPKQTGPQRRILKPSDFSYWLTNVSKHHPCAYVRSGKSALPRRRIWRSCPPGPPRATRASLFRRRRGEGVLPKSSQRGVVARAPCRPCAPTRRTTISNHPPLTANLSSRRRRGDETLTVSTRSTQCHPGHTTSPNIILALPSDPRRTRSVPPCHMPCPARSSTCHEPTFPVQLSPPSFG